MPATINISILLTSSQWKVLVIDESAKKIIDNVVKEDDILNENIASMWERET
jgi:syntaxin-binding protein 1